MGLLDVWVGKVFAVKREGETPFGSFTTHQEYAALIRKVRTKRVRVVGVFGICLGESLEMDAVLDIGEARKLA